MELRFPSRVGMQVWRNKGTFEAFLTGSFGGFYTGFSEGFLNPKP